MAHLVVTVLALLSQWVHRTNLQGDPMSNHPLSYVLITPARNEEAFIERTIRSVISQTILPTKWVIVNDGSTDATSKIVRQYLADHPWMELVDLPARRDR